MGKDFEVLLEVKCSFISRSFEPGEIQGHSCSTITSMYDLLTTDMLRLCKRIMMPVRTPFALSNLKGSGLPMTQMCDMSTSASKTSSRLLYFLKEPVTRRLCLASMLVVAHISYLIHTNFETPLALNHHQILHVLGVGTHLSERLPHPLTPKTG